MTDVNDAAGAEFATFAGGCFWCLEAPFRQLAGVESVISGYTGGHVANPTYQQVCSGATGHAEAIRICYDPAVIAYRELLDIFFTLHDPTTRNRQGNDVGTQYRSAVYYHSPAQQRAAQEAIDELDRQHIFPSTVVTEVMPAAVFYPAEDDHQQYFARHPEQPYCLLVVAPKVAKVRSKFAEKIKQSAG